jgi:hypothetical protein
MWRTCLTTAYNYWVILILDIIFVVGWITACVMLTFDFVVFPSGYGYYRYYCPWKWMNSTTWNERQRGVPTQAAAAAMGLAEA